MYRSSRDQIETLALATVVALQPTCVASQEAPNELPVAGDDASAQDRASGPDGEVLSGQRLLQLTYRVGNAPGTTLSGTRSRPPTHPCSAADYAGARSTLEFR